MTLRIGLLTALLCAHHAASADLLVREIEVEGRKVLIDNRPVKLSIEVLDEFVDDRAGAALARGLHRSYREAWEAARAANVRLLPSVSLVYGKCKRFEDGMYAAVDLAVEEPVGKLSAVNTTTLAFVPVISFGSMVVFIAPLVFLQFRGSEGLRLPLLSSL